MAMIHDWHRPDEDQASPRYVTVEALFRVDPDGGLTIKLLDRNGRMFSVALSQKEGDRLGELLWTDRK